MRRSLRAVDSPDVLAELADLLAYASGEVTRIAPLAPDAVHNRAATSIVGYIYDRPTAGRDMAYANAVRNSGAGAMLLPYRKHRGGTTALDTLGGYSAGFSSGYDVVMDA